MILCLGICVCSKSTCFSCFLYAIGRGGGLVVVWYGRVLHAGFQFVSVAEPNGICEGGLEELHWDCWTIKILSSEISGIAAPESRRILGLWCF
jgi:hypothetical protein